MVRRAGIPSMDTVSAVVLEADGSVSVMDSDVERLELPHVSLETPPSALATEGCSGSCPDPARPRAP